VTAHTRDRLVEAAAELFFEQGYLATSVNQILKRAEANSGSLYYFFETKQDLLLAVLDRYLTGIDEMLLQPAWEGVADPVERVFALLGRYRELILMTEFQYGCPIGSLALEIHEADPAVREKLRQNFVAWVDAVERCYRLAGDRLPADLDRRALAELTLATMEGGVMLARTARTIEAFDAPVAMLRDYVDRLSVPAR
jgi:AcrR family transcriptional regulator